MPGYAKPPSYFARNISLTPAGNISSTTLQAGIEELDSEKTTESYVNAEVASVPTGSKNLIYNGAMQVHQRGTSVAGIDTGYYTADRYQSVNGLQGTWTQSIEADGPNGSGLTKSLKMLCTAADAAPSASDQLRVRHILEGQDLQRIAKGTASAKPLTLSFWVKSNVTGTYVVEAYDFDNTRMVCNTYTISASATWEKKTITFPADTTGAFDNDNGASLYLSFWLGVGSDFTSGTLPTTWESATTANRAVGQTNLAAATNNYWQITGVQLEVGDTATEFEHLPYGVELAKCQRYFCVLGQGTGDGGPYDLNNCSMTFRYPQSMRSAATVTFPSTLTNAVQWIGKGAVTPTSVATALHSPDGFQVNLFTSGGYPSISTYSQAVWGNIQIQASAEL